MLDKENHYLFDSKGDFLLKIVCQSHNQFIFSPGLVPVESSFRPGLVTVMFTLGKHDRLNLLNADGCVDVRSATVSVQSA